MPHFILKYTPPRSTFIDDATAEESAAVAEHFDYLKKLLEDGTLTIAGRTEDASYGIAVFKAETAEAAAAVVERDPAVNAGVFTPELKLFRLALLGKE